MRESNCDSGGRRLIGGCVDPGSGGGGHGVTSSCSPTTDTATTTTTATASTTDTTTITNNHSHTSSGRATTTTDIALDDEHHHQQQQQEYLDTVINDIIFDTSDPHDLGCPLNAPSSSTPVTCSTSTSTPSGSGTHRYHHHYPEESMDSHHSNVTSLSSSSYPPPSHTHHQTFFPGVADFQRTAHMTDIEDLTGRAVSADVEESTSSTATAPTAKDSFHRKGSKSTPKNGGGREKRKSSRINGSSTGTTANSSGSAKNSNKKTSPSGVAGSSAKKTCWVWQYVSVEKNDDDSIYKRCIFCPDAKFSGKTSSSTMSKHVKDFHFELLDPDIQTMLGGRSENPNAGSRRRSNRKQSLESSGKSSGAFSHVTNGTTHTTSVSTSNRGGGTSCREKGESRKGSRRSSRTVTTSAVSSPTATGSDMKTRRSSACAAPPHRSSVSSSCGGLGCSSIKRAHSFSSVGNLESFNVNRMKFMTKNMVKWVMEEGVSFKAVESPFFRCMLESCEGYVGSCDYDGFVVPSIPSNALSDESLKKNILVEIENMFNVGKASVKQYIMDKIDSLRKDNLPCTQFMSVYASSWVYRNQSFLCAFVSMLPIPSDHYQKPTHHPTCPVSSSSTPTNPCAPSPTITHTTTTSTNAPLCSVIEDIDADKEDGDDEELDSRVKMILLDVKPVESLRSVSCDDLLISIVQKDYGILPEYIHGFVSDGTFPVEKFKKFMKMGYASCERQMPSTHMYSRGHNYNDALNEFSVSFEPILEKVRKIATHMYDNSGLATTVWRTIAKKRAVYSSIPNEEEEMDDTEEMPEKRARTCSLSGSAEDNDKGSSNAKQEDGKGSRGTLRVSDDSTASASVKCEEPTNIGPHDGADSEPCSSSGGGGVQQLSPELESFQKSLYSPLVGNDSCLSSLRWYSAYHLASTSIHDLIRNFIGSYVGHLNRIETSSTARKRYVCGGLLSQFGITEREWYELESVVEILKKFTETSNALLGNVSSTPSMAVSCILMEGLSVSLSNAICEHHLVDDVEEEEEEEGLVNMVNAEENIVNSSKTSSSGSGTNGGTRQSHHHQLSDGVRNALVFLRARLSSLEAIENLNSAELVSCVLDPFYKRRFVSNDAMRLKCYRSLCGFLLADEQFAEDIPNPSQLSLSTLCNCIKACVLEYLTSPTESRPDHESPITTTVEIHNFWRDQYLHNRRSKAALPCPCNHNTFDELHIYECLKLQALCALCTLGMRACTINTNAFCGEPSIAYSEGFMELIEMETASRESRRRALEREFLMGAFETQRNCLKIASDKLMDATKAQQTDEKAEKGLGGQNEMAVEKAAVGQQTTQLRVKPKRPSNFARNDHRVGCALFVIHNWICSGIRVSSVGNHPVSPTGTSTSQHSPTSPQTSTREGSPSPISGDGSKDPKREALPPTSEDTCSDSSSSIWAFYSGACGKDVKQGNMVSLSSLVDFKSHSQYFARNEDAREKLLFTGASGRTVLQTLTS